MSTAGSPHIHGLLWINGAPEYGEDDDELVCAFVDRFITTDSKLASE